MEQAVTATLQDPANDTQGALALLRMAYVSRATFLSRYARPEATSSTELPLRRFDATVRVALASMMQEPLATAATGFDDNGTCDDFSVCFDSIRSDAWSLDREAPVSGTALTQQLDDEHKPRALHQPQSSARSRENAHGTHTRTHLLPCACILQCVHHCALPIGRSSSAPNQYAHSVPIRWLLMFSSVPNQERHSVPIR